MGKWKHQLYGTPTDPIRQSDLNDIASNYGCSKRFELRKEAEASGEDLEWESTGADRCIGTAIHETIRIYLTDEEARGRVLAGELPSLRAVDEVIRREFDKATEGLPVNWKKRKPETEYSAAVVMTRGVLRDVGARAREIVLCEAPFVAEVAAGEKSYVLTGTVDLVYRSKEGALVLCDWKSGTDLPQIVLDHGYQFGIYSYALAHGVFFPGTERELRIGQWPAELFCVQLRDFVPYQKATARVIERDEEAVFFGVPKGSRVEIARVGGRKPPKLKKDGTPAKKRERKHATIELENDQRGPAWYRSMRTPEDVARLTHSLRKIVSGVRLGVLYETIGSNCNRCAFKTRCLSDGYALDAAASGNRELSKLADELGHTGLEGFAA